MDEKQIGPRVIELVDEFPSTTILSTTKRGRNYLTSISTALLPCKEWHRIFEVREELGVEEPDLSAVLASDAEDVTIAKRPQGALLVTHGPPLTPALGTQRAKQVEASFFSDVQPVRVQGCGAAVGVVDGDPPELVAPAIDNVRGEYGAETHGDLSVDGLGAFNPLGTQLVAGVVVCEMQHGIVVASWEQLRD